MGIRKIGEEDLERVWNGVIVVIENTEELSFKENIPIILENLNVGSVDNISSFLRKIRNKMMRILKKGSAELAQEQEIGVKIVEFGTILEGENIELQLFLQPTPQEKLINCTKGLVCDLRKIRIHHLNMLAFGFTLLCKLDYFPDPDGLKRQFDRIYFKQLVLRRQNRTEKLLEFLNAKYCPALEKSALPSEPKSVCVGKKVDNVVNVLIKVPNNEFDVSKLQKRYLKNREQKCNSNLKLFRLKKEYKKLKLKYENSAAKLATLS